MQTLCFQKILFKRRIYFSNSPFETLGKCCGQILTFEERLYKLDNLHVEFCVKAFFDKTFSQLSPIQFLDNFIRYMSVKGIVVGKDYTFGKKGEGNISTLAKWCEENSVELSIVDFERDNGKKIASTDIRDLLMNGDLKKANDYLVKPYFVYREGEFMASKRGRNIGFATANLEYPANKLKIQPGAYYTRTCINGVWLKSVTNVGEHPTFDDGNFNIESHVIYYDGDIYGEKIIVEFLERIRDIRKFSSKDELAEQITRDIQFAMNSDL